MGVIFPKNPDTAWHGIFMTRQNMAWHGMPKYGMARGTMTWHGMARGHPELPTFAQTKISGDIMVDTVGRC